MNGVDNNTSSHSIITDQFKRYVASTSGCTALNHASGRSHLAQTRMTRRSARFPGSSTPLMKTVTDLIVHNSTICRVQIQRTPAVVRVMHRQSLCQGLLIHDGRMQSRKSHSLACLGTYSSHVRQSKLRASSPMTNLTNGRPILKKTWSPFSDLTLSTSSPVLKIARICLDIQLSLLFLSMSLTRNWIQGRTMLLLTIGISANFHPQTILDELRRTGIFHYLAGSFFDDANAMTTHASCWGLSALDVFAML